MRNVARGQSLIEILFAVALFTIGVVTIGYLTIDSFATLRYTNEVVQARLLAIEGIEALHTIRDTDFSNIFVGTHGLALQDGVWVLVAAPDTQGKFTRTVTVSKIDPDVFAIVVSVSWKDTPIREKSISLETRISNWMQMYGDAGGLMFDTSNVLLVASSTTVTGVYLENTKGHAVAIDGIIVDWETDVVLKRITIEGTDVFTASTTAPAVPRSYIDIPDYKLGAYSGFRAIDALEFSGSVESSNFVVTFVCTDGTRRHLPIFR